MLVIGIDPGVTGAIAIVGDDFARVHDMPTREVLVDGKPRPRLDLEALAHLLEETANRLPFGSEAFVERATASPHMGVSSAFSYGEGFGVLRGMLAVLGVPVHLVTAKSWRVAMGLATKGHRELGRNAARDKKPSLDLARRLYPGLAADLAREKDNGRADALLIAHYGCEQLEGQLFAHAHRPEPQRLVEVEF